MKARKEFVADFESVEMDEILLRWLIGGVNPSDRAAFEKTLLFDKRFREHFCEWIKGIREPAWALQIKKKKRTPMNESTRDILLDCLSHLWALSRKSDDYWQQVASLEWEESLSLFDSIRCHPNQLGELFGEMADDESAKILSTFETLVRRARSQTPGFFEIALWAAVVEAKSQTLRRDVVRVAIELDRQSRKMIGAANEMSEPELHRYLLLSNKFVRLSKHLHPAFSHSDTSPTSGGRKNEAASG